MDNFKFARHFGPWLSLRLWDLQPESGSVTDGGAGQRRDLIMPPVDHVLGEQSLNVVADAVGRNEQGPSDLLWWMPTIGRAATWRS